MKLVWSLFAFLRLFRMAVAENNKIVIYWRITITTCFKFSIIFIAEASIAALVKFYLLLLLSLIIIYSLLYALFLYLDLLFTTDDC